MELTRFDLQNQVIQRRIAEALERIAQALEKLAGGTNFTLDSEPKDDEGGGR